MMPLPKLYLLIALSCHTFVMCAAAKLPPVVTPEQASDGWIALADGESLFGWSSSNEKVDWHLDNGAIVATDGPAGFLVSNAEFADYELHVEFRGNPKTNGGVFLHTTARPGSPATECYEINIAPPDNPYPTGSIVARQKGDEVADDYAAHEWHSFDIRVEGPIIEIHLDGHLICRYTDPTPLRRGHIALQHNSGEVAYRNIRLKPLGTKSLFNGEDLSGWNTDRAAASRSTVTDEGELRIQGGWGQLESQSQHADFVLQLDCRIDGDGLNSGVFFRCIPGDMMMGYECQLSNAMKEGDPQRPSDAGTGGIYRRQDARRIVARDHEWFTLTLVAHGAHVAAWVNGVQVSDWTDERPLHENPRNGRRLDAGTLAIQGHDPKTDLRFRQIRIADFPTRVTE